MVPRTLMSSPGQLIAATTKVIAPPDDLICATTSLIARPRSLIMAPRWLITAPAADHFGISAFVRRADLQVRLAGRPEGLRYAYPLLVTSG